MEASIVLSAVLDFDADSAGFEKPIEQLARLPSDYQHFVAVGEGSSFNLQYLSAIDAKEQEHRFLRRQSFELFASLRIL